MHTIIGITSYKRDTDEIRKYLENLKQVEYLREIKLYDIISSDEDSEFIANLLYPSSTYQKLYKRIPSMIRNLLSKAGIVLHKPEPEILRPDFLIRSKAVFVLKSEDYWIEGKEMI